MDYMSVFRECLELLDVQLQYCEDMGAVIDYDNLDAIYGGNERQNSYYKGHLNMLELTFMRVGLGGVKWKDGHHVSKIGWLDGEN